MYFWLIACLNYLESKILNMISISWENRMQLVLKLIRSKPKSTFYYCILQVLKKNIMFYKWVSVKIVSSDITGIFRATLWVDISLGHLGSWISLILCECLLWYYWCFIRVSFSPRMAFGISFIGTNNYRYIF